MTVLNKAHSKVSETEHENTGIEAAHKTEQKAESILRFGNRTGRMIIQNRKNAPYKKAARLQFRAEKAEAKAFVQKTLADNPDFKKKISFEEIFSEKAD